MAIANQLKWKKYHPLSDQNAFICLVDCMGDDSSIVQAARVSYDKDEQKPQANPDCPDCDGTGKDPTCKGAACDCKWIPDISPKDRHLIRYLMNHAHTTPFEMVEFKFMIQVPMDCWRQWIRHRTANVNEYSTRYTEAIDAFQITQPTEWRLQATDNKQGSSGFLEAHLPTSAVDGECLTIAEERFHASAKLLYQDRLKAGIAKEQARKDLPLSTYTRAYWKCDLHNIFNFLRLRMDSHAQLEIRSFANSMYEIIKPICPVACEAFEDYVLHAKRFSRMEMEILRNFIRQEQDTKDNTTILYTVDDFNRKPSSMTDREWKEFIAKLS